MLCFEDIEEEIVCIDREILPDASAANRTNLVAELWVVCVLSVSWLSDVDLCSRSTYTV